MFYMVFHLCYLGLQKAAGENEILSLAAFAFYKI